MRGPVPMPGGKCPQCGFFHPPIPQGQECPMKKKTDNYGREIDMTQFFKNLRTMVETQIQIKKIKDHDKLFKTVIIEINKFIENYKE